MAKTRAAVTWRLWVSRYVVRMIWLLALCAVQPSAMEAMDPPPLAEGLPRPTPPPAEVTVPITVAIVDAEGRPAPGVVVTTVYPDGARFSAVTDAEGRPRLAAVEPGTYEIEAWLEGFATVTTKITVRPGQSSSLKIALPGALPERLRSSGAGVSSAVAAAAAIETILATPRDDLPLQQLLSQRASDGWSLVSAVPMEPGSSIFVFKRQSGAVPCTAQLVSGALTAEVLQTRLALMPTRRFAGVHLLAPARFAFILCEG